MFRSTLAGVVAVLLAAASAGVSAQSTPRIDGRQAYQEWRINQGIATGSLNAPEAARLEAGQARVGRMEGRALSDGVVSHGEQVRIEQAQDVQSRRIWRQKHDAQVRR
jgi:hypothetical protein